MGQSLSSITSKTPSKPGQPPQSDVAPNFQGAVQQQTGLNTASGLLNYILNNANQTNPFGSKSLTFDAQGNPTINTSLNPADQQRLDLQRAASGGALAGSGGNVLDMMQKYLGTDPNAGLPAMQYGVGGGTPGQIMSDTENAAFNQLISRLNPQMTQQTQALNARLANMGGVTGNPAAMRAQTNLGLTQDDAIRQAALSAMTAGQQAATSNFNMGATNVGLNNAGIGQKFGQNVTTQNLPLQQMAALLGLGPSVQAPTFGASGLGTPTGVAPANAQQGALNQGQYNIGANPLAATSWQQLLGTGSNVANSLLGGSGGIGGLLSSLGGGIGSLVKGGAGSLMDWIRGLGGVNGVGGLPGDMSGGIDLGGFGDASGLDLSGFTNV